METGKKQKKKAAGAALAAAVLASAALTAYAAEGVQTQPGGVRSQTGVQLKSNGVQTQSMELTFDKAPTYILTIPKDQSISFGRVDTDIGVLSVKGSIGAGQEVLVSVGSTEFTADGGGSFSFSLMADGSEFEGKTWSSREVNGETTELALTVHIPTQVWGSAGPGTYEAALSFQAELRGGN